MKNLLAFVLCIMHITLHAQELTLAVADIDILLDEYLKETGKIKDIQAFNTETTKDIQTHKSKIQTLRSLLTAKKNQEHTQELHNLERAEEEFQQFLTTKSKEHRTITTSIKQEALTKVLTVLEEYRKATQLQVILNKKDTLAFRDDLDITNIILTKIKELF